jgi:hypothetical protein
MSSSSNSVRLKIRQASQEQSVEMSASMPPTLRTAELNRQTFRYFRDFQQAHVTAAILLSQAGIGSMLVERHESTAVHPKARAINGRTMEIYRLCGVEAAMRSAGLPLSCTGMIIWATTLAEEEIERRIPWRASQQASAVSPDLLSLGFDQELHARRPDTFLLICRVS